jgi:two-component system response regulator NreC
MERDGGPSDNEAETVRKLGIILVDPLPVITEGLALFVEREPDMEVLAQATAAEQGLAALDRVGRQRNVLVLIAMELPGECDAFWLIRTIRERYPAVTVVGMGVNSIRMNVTRALFMGADAYINKGAAPGEFLDALRRSADGEMVLAGLPSDWFGPIVDEIENEQKTNSTLTEREREILAIAAQGLRARDIGDRLGVSERTITTHLANIYKKLGVHGRGAAVAAAARSGLVALDAPQ